MVSDKDAVTKIAKLWIKCGGDAEGFINSIGNIFDKIKELDGEDDW
jgi:hypothetical protein